MLNATNPYPVTRSDISKAIKLNISLADINKLDQKLMQYLQPKFLIQSNLTRSLVSFQANKTCPIYRWYKYKEAFSATLIESLFKKYGVSNGRILDPFAGSGTTLFAASALGIDTDGIELLPIGQQIIAAKQILETEFNTDDFNILYKWRHWFTPIF